MVGTRWNVADPLGRIEEQYRDNPRYRFTVLPALNENGEGNFNYKYNLGLGNVKERGISVEQAWAEVSKEL